MSSPQIFPSARCFEWRRTQSFISFSISLRNAPQKEQIRFLGDACIFRQLCAKVNIFHHHYSAKVLGSVVLDTGTTRGASNQIRQARLRLQKFLSTWARAEKPLLFPISKRPSLRETRLTPCFIIGNVRFDFR